MGLNAVREIGSAGLFANGAAIASYTAPISTTDVIWPASWTPASAGVYTLTATITDTAAFTATSPANVVYVDLAGPSVAIAAESITQAKLAKDGSYPLQGTASDDSEVARVEVRLNGGPWQRRGARRRRLALQPGPAGPGEPRWRQPGHRGAGHGQGRPHGHGDGQRHPGRDAAGRL